MEKVQAAAISARSLRASGPSVARSGRAEKISGLPYTKPYPAQSFLFQINDLCSSHVGLAAESHVNYKGIVLPVAAHDSMPAKSGTWVGMRARGTYCIYDVHFRPSSHRSSPAIAETEQVALSAVRITALLSSLRGEGGGESKSGAANAPFTAQLTFCGKVPVPFKNDKTDADAITTPTT